MKYLPLILRNLRRQLRRTTLTAVAFTVATLLFATLESVPASLDRIEGDYTRGTRVVVNNYNGPYGLPARYCDEIRSMQYITGCAPMNVFYMMYRKPQESIGLYAIDREFLR